MARCPFAEWKPVPYNSSDPRITATQGILHVDAGNASSLWRLFLAFQKTSGIEAHFFVKKNGDLEQYRDTNIQADANYKANPRAISVETQGFGSGKWTPEQLATIKRLMLWLEDVEGIPLKVCPEWDEPGWGYHIMFGSPGAWTPVAKSCPGPNRIKQFKSVLVPWMREQNKPKPEPKPLPPKEVPPAAPEEKDEFDMASITDVTKAVTAALKPGIDATFKAVARVEAVARRTEGRVMDLDRRLTELEKQEK